MNETSNEAGAGPSRDDGNPIPVQLRNWRFVTVRKNSKAALEKDNFTENNYARDDPKLLNHLANGGNVGLACGPLQVVVDIDPDGIDLKLDEQLDALGPTFIAGTPGVGKRCPGKHYAFVVDKPLSILMLGEKGSIGHVKAGADGRLGSYVVCAPSTIDGHPYKVLAANEVAHITRDQLLDVVGEYVQVPKEVKRTGGHYDLTSMSWNATASHYGFHSPGRIPHPKHGSDTKTNFNILDDHAICSRHTKRYDPIYLVAVMEDVINCGDQLEGDAFKDACAKAVERGLMDEPVYRGRPVSTTPLSGAMVMEVSRSDGRWITSVRDGGDLLVVHGSKTAPWLSDKIMAAIVNKIADATQMNIKSIRPLVSKALASASEKVKEPSGEDLVKKVLEATEGFFIITGSTPSYQVKLGGRLFDLSIAQMNGPPGVLANLWLSAFPTDRITPNGSVWSQVRDAWLTEMAAEREPEDVTDDEVKLEMLAKDLRMKLRAHLYDTPKALALDVGAYVSEDKEVVWVPSAIVGDWKERNGGKWSMSDLSKKCQEADLTVGVTKPHRAFDKLVRAWPFSRVELGFPDGITLRELEADGAVEDDPDEDEEGDEDEE